MKNLRKRHMRGCIQSLGLARGEAGGERGEEGRVAGQAVKRGERRVGVLAHLTLGLCAA